MRCDECKGDLVYDGKGDMVCVECGLVHAFGAAPRSFPGKKQRLGSLISKNSTFFADASDRKLHSKEQVKYNRLKRLQESAYNGSCFDMVRVQKDLESIAKDLSLPVEAVEITLRFFDRLLSRLKNPYGSYGMLMAVCLASVSRELGERAPIRLSELVDAFRRRGYKLSTRVVARNLNFHSFFIPFKKKFRKSEDYVGKVVGKLRVSPYIAVRVRLIGFEPEEYFMRLHETSKMLLANLPPPRRSGKNPFLLAASAVYKANELMARSKSGENVVTKSQFSRDIGIAEYTLRSHLSTVFSRNGAMDGGSLTAQV